MKLQQIFITTIERSKQMRIENIEKITNFGKQYFDISVIMGGVDGSRIQSNQLQNYIEQGVIKPSQNKISSLDELIYMPNFQKQRFMSSSEIGCFLSHISFWNQIIIDDIECALILEDDAYFDDSLLHNQIEEILHDHDSLKFHTVSLFKHHNQKDKKLYLPYNDKYHLIDARAWGTVSYLITKEGARALLKEALPIAYPVDYAMNKIMEINKKGFLVKNSIITLSDNESVVRQNNTNEVLPSSNINIPICLIKTIENLFAINADENYLSFTRNKCTAINFDIDHLSNNDIEKIVIDGLIIPVPNYNHKNNDEMIYSKEMKRFLTKGEINTFISHYKAWQSMVENKTPYAIIYDDSINIVDKQMFQENVINAMKNAPQGFSTISLKATMSNTNSMQSINNIFYKNNHTQLDSSIYIISLIGAIQFIQKIPHIENTLAISMRNVEQNSKITGYILQKNDSIQCKPKILEIQPVKENFKLDTFYFIGNKNEYKIGKDLYLKPQFFNFSQQITLKALLSSDPSMINTNLIRDGKIWDEASKRLLNDSDIHEYLTHSTLWKVIVDRNIDIALITSKYVRFCGNNEDLKEMVSKIPFRGHIVALTKSEGILKCNDDFYYLNNKTKDLDAYIVTKKGAKMLLQNHKPISNCIGHYVHTHSLIENIGYVSHFPFFSKDI